MDQDEGYWIWVLRGYSYLRKKGWICLFKEKSGSAFLAPTWHLACGERIRGLGTQLLDLVVEQSAQIFYRIVLT